MRIVLLADHAVAEGGAPQVAMASALALAARGHAVTYLHAVGTTGDARLDTTPGITRIGLGGQDIWDKGALAAARDGIWNRPLTRKLQAALQGFSPDDSVVHVHQWTKCFSPSLFAVLAQAGLPVVISMHDYFLTCPVGLMYRFDQAQPCALRPMSAACMAAPCDPRSFAHKAIRLLRTAAARHAMGNLPFVALHVSEVGRRTIGAHLPPGARQIVIENPVDAADSGPRHFTGQRRVVYCGRLTVDKGADLVAEAARQAGLPSLFIGEGPLRERLKEIDPETEITGWLDKETLARRIREEALCLVAPSRWPETGPLVVAEAMSAGVPVIVSDRAGASGRVVQGVTGLVVPPEAAALSAALRQLAAPAVAQAAGEAAYHAYWADPPSPQAHAARLEALYRELLPATGNPAANLPE